MTLSIVMPALNEAENIQAALENTLHAFDDFGISGEVIVVNDGSTDGTPAIVQEMMAQDTRIGMILHSKPQGIGAAFWDGVEQATGQIVSMFPGDNENDPWEILRYYGLLEHVDIVIPFAFNKKVRSLWRIVLSFLFLQIVNVTFWVRFHYTNGTILYRKALLDQLSHRSTGFFFQTDILIRLAKRGYLFVEVPYRLGQRKHGTSKSLSWSSLLRVSRDYLRLLRDIYAPKGRQMRKVFVENSVTAKRHAGFEENEQKIRIAENTPEPETEELS